MTEKLTKRVEFLLIQESENESLEVTLGHCENIKYLVFGEIIELKYLVFGEIIVIPTTRDGYVYP